MAIQSVEDLRVYQLSLQQLSPVYKLAKKVERQDQILARNLRKTALQIAPQIAEGYAKKSSANEFRRYLHIALGSSDEIVTHLRQTKIILFLTSQECESLIENYRALSKQINVLIKNWH